MKKILLIYDDHIRPNLFIQSIIGNKSFGDVILKRESQKQKFFSFMQGQELTYDMMELSNAWEIEPFLSKLRALRDDYSVLHIFSNQVIRDPHRAAYLMKKVSFVNTPTIAIQDRRPVLFMLNSLEDYLQFLENNFQRLQSPECFVKFDITETDAFFDISIHSNFLGYISGGFDARFFNSVQGDEFTVTKSSQDIEKIRAEYEFYNLLPDEMKIWFVMPYHFQEEASEASYQMERLHMTDLAIRYAHGAIDLQECAQLLHKISRFINDRKSKSISKEEQRMYADALYLQKLDKRIEQLKQCSEYRQLSSFLKAGTEIGSIDNIVEHYKKLYDVLKVRREREQPVAVIGHGDLCFSNILL